MKHCEWSPYHWIPAQPLNENNIIVAFKRAVFGKVERCTQQPTRDA